MPGLAIYWLMAAAQTDTWFKHDGVLWEVSYVALDLELTSGPILRRSSI